MSIRKEQSTQTISYTDMMNQMYETYMCDVCRVNLNSHTIEDGETANSSDDDDEKSEMGILDKLDDRDIEELNHTCESYVLEFIENNIVQFSKGNFDTEIAANVTYILYQSLYDTGIITEDDYDDLYEHIHSICNHTLSTLEIPEYYEYHIKESVTRNVDQVLISSLHNCSFRVPESVKAQNSHLAELKDVKQRTNEWYELRHHILTASNIWKAFASESQRNSLIYEKCSPFIKRDMEGGCVNTSSPLHWGVKYEPLTVMLYEYKNDTKIDEFGCIQHPEYDFLGASPDGINVKE